MLWLVYTWCVWSYQVGGRKEFLFCFSSDTERDGWLRDIDTVLREEGWKKIFY